MFEIITPEKAGISSLTVKKFLETLERRGLVMHSVLLMRGDNIFSENYWAPFDKDFCHRMYSQTKSFVGVAIGILEGEGKLSISDTVASYFPERINRDLPPYLKNLTIRDMLTMETAGEHEFWLLNENAKDRVQWYFDNNSSTHPGGTIWKYDSEGSQVLSVLVEKVSGMPLFEFLNDRIFKHLGTFKTAYTLKVRNDDTFGDSSMICTTRDMASFARFVMNKGKIGEKQIAPESYMTEAIKPLVDNNNSGFINSAADGYGYQIWAARDGGFAFHGMGSQFTICYPEKNFLFTCTGDNQGFDAAEDLIFSAVFELLVDNLSDSPLPENEKDYKELLDYSSGLKLAVQKGVKHTPFADEVSGKVFKANENPMGITSFSLNFDGDEGEFKFTNKQGDKVIRFGLGKNVFDKFPEYGYSDIHAGNKTTDGFLYDAASSAAWTEEKKLLLNVKIIDKYFGNISMIFSFKDDKVVLDMAKHAEVFLEEYNGQLVATR